MAELIWEKQWSVGNLVIDAGHQNLIGMINSLEHAIRQQDGSQLLRIFERLCDSASLHFKDEERIMQAVKFPFVPHRLEHQHLLSELRNTLGELVAEDGAESGHAMHHYPEFLRDWFVSHIHTGVATLKPVLQAYPYDFMPV